MHNRVLRSNIESKKPKQCKKFCTKESWFFLTFKLQASMDLLYFFLLNDSDLPLNISFNYLSISLSNTLFSSNVFLLISSWVFILFFLQENYTICCLVLVFHFHTKIYHVFQKKSNKIEFLPIFLSLFDIQKKQKFEDKISLSFPIFLLYWLKIYPLYRKELKLEKEFNLIKVLITKVLSLGKIIRQGCFSKQVFLIF